MSRGRIVEGDGDPRHGTANGYRNLGCHCDPCTKAGTKKTWPDEDREAVLARITEEHGEEVASIVADDWEQRVKGAERPISTRARRRRYQQVRRSAYR